MQRSTKNIRPVLLSVGLISVAVLAYEIILLRLFSITQWHHFAYMIISIALLGFGAAGSCISVFRKTFLRSFESFFRLFALLFPCAILLSYVLSGHNDFNPAELVWNPRQYLYVLEYYLVLFVPFLLAALAIGLSFTRYTDKIGLLYASNLGGSGLGALGASLGLYLFHPVLLLYVVFGIALLGALLPLLTRRNSLPALMLLGGILIFSVRYDPLNLQDMLHVSPYKGLSQARNFPEAELVAEALSPLGVIHAVSSPIIRHAPGLSLNYSGEIPSQIGIFIDAGAAGAIVRVAADGSPLSQGGLQTKSGLEFFRFLPASLPYYLRPASKVLILGAGGGADVLNALYHGADSVDAVELDRRLIEVVRDIFHKETGGLYSWSQVELFNQEARAFVESTQRQYDVIQLSLLDAFGASTAGVHALHENYLYTLEALQRYYERLSPGGVLAITRWLKFPPRDNIKLFATALEALEGLGEENIEERLVAIRSWATHTLLVSKSPFQVEDIAALRDFCEERSFDLNYFPGIQPEEANRFNQLPSAEFFYAMQALLSEEREALYDAYPYYIRPARDDSPYFSHFFKWKSFTRLLNSIGRDWIPFVEWGYLVLLATLLQAGLLSLLLILVPLLFLPRRTVRFREVLTTTLFFGSLGLGYLFIEMVCIQKFTLFLANPVLTASVLIASFLIFSGLGSLCFEFRQAGSTLFFGAISGIVLLCLFYTLFLSSLFSTCAGWGSAAKILLSILCIAPLGFCMGIPFPCGLKYVGRRTEQLVPWAYGVNGCASVLSSLIATSIAISHGFQSVFLLAGLLYLGTAVIGLLLPRH
ncbi:MAG: SAM-dependent methyltransferase [bacterium]|nr:SAM-dependent methyltransferase [bacterium]